MPYLGRVIKETQRYMSVMCDDFSYEGYVHEGFIKLYLLSNDIELLGYNIPAKVSNIIIMHNKISDSYFYWANGYWKYFKNPYLYIIPIVGQLIRFIVCSVTIWFWTKSQLGYT